MRARHSLEVMAKARLGRTRGETILLLVLVIASGILVWVPGYAFMTLSYDGSEEEALDLYMPYMLAEIPIALIVWALVPWAIEHEPDELTQHGSAPGRKRTLIAALIIAFIGGGVLAFPAHVVVLISIVSRGSTRWTVSVICAALVGYTLIAVTDPEWETNLGNVVLQAAISLFFIICALLIGQYRFRRAEAARILQAEADTARADERTRIARDMHDTISHRLSLIAIHAGALEQQPDIAERAEIAATIKEQSAKAVEDLGQVLRILRTDSDPLTSVDMVVAEARSAGQNVDTRGEIAEISTAHAHLIHRAITEALTNARKHSPGAPVLVEYFENGLRVTTQGAAGPSDGNGGHGLLGLRERARLLGATVSVRHRLGEHVLEVKLS